MRLLSGLILRGVPAALLAASMTVPVGTAAADDKKDTLQLTVEYEPFLAGVKTLWVYVLPKGADVTSTPEYLNSGYVDTKVSGRTRKTAASYALPVPAGDDRRLRFDYVFVTKSGVANGFDSGQLDLPIRPGAALHLVLGNGKSDRDIFPNGDCVRVVSSTYAYTELDKAVKAVEVKEQAVQAAEDSPQVKKEEYTVRHSASVQEGWRKEVEAKGELKLNFPVVELVIGASVKAGIERSTSKAVEASHTSTREVTIPGNGKKYKVVWVETYRTGRAVTVIDGKRYEIPFEYRDGWDLQTRLVKD